MMATSEADEPILRVAGVTHDFLIRRGLARTARLRAVEDVVLDVRRGEVLAVVGESGSGKTTLAKIMLGLITPSRGTVEINGRAVAAMSRRELPRAVQFIFQDPYSSLNPMRTIGAILMQPLRIAGIGSRGEIERDARRMLDVVGLPSHMFDRTPGQLSGGQRQRVVIARALIVRPQIVVCDEPTSALDVSVQAQILNLLLDLRREFGLTYVFISHNLAVVRHIASRIGVMYLGRIVELGEADSLFRDPRHPYTRALLKSVMPPKPRGGIPDLQLGAHIPNPMEAIAGCRFRTRCPEAIAACANVAPARTTSGEHSVECHVHSLSPAVLPVRESDS